MRKIAAALWNYPSVFAGALQAGNAALAAEAILPTWVSVTIATLVAVVNVAAVSPAYPKASD